MTAAARKLFVYGTLCDADIRARVIGRELAAGDRLAARAPGLVAVRLAGRTYPTLVPGAGAAEGLVLVGLSAAEIARLDRYEGDEYSRVATRVEIAGTAATVETYLARPGVAASDAAWSLAAWRRRDKRAALAEIAALPDHQSVNART